MIQDASEVLTLLLEGGRSKVAGRLAGAFRNIGNDKIADQIIKTMRTADCKVQEEDPFEEKPIQQSVLFLAISYLSISTPIWMGMAAWGDF